MTEQEANALIQQGSAIDAGEAAHAEAAATGMLDGGGLVVQADPDAKAMEWMLVPEMLAFALVAIFPETAQHYTDAAKLDLARKIVPVADKYGWNGLGDSPELMLAIGGFGFAMPAVMAYRARKAERAEQAQQDKQQGGDPQPSVTAGYGS